MRVGCVIPAAGEGRRLGGPKALATLGGRPFVARVAAAALEVASDVVVVVGASAEAARAHVPPGARVVENAAWREGRTRSVQEGVRALRPCDAFLVWPVDVPLATPDDARALLATARGRAAVPVAAGRRGHPVLLPEALRGAVLALPPGAPLHDVVRTADPVEVPVDNAGVLHDVNTPDDLRRAEGLLAGLAGAVE